MANRVTASTQSQHWDEVYSTKAHDQVSWFQQEPSVSLELIESLHLEPAQPIVDVGGGTSTLVDRLLECGHTGLTVLDISAHALHLARLRLAERSHRVQWLVADLLRWTPPRRFALWHDRAVFHFLTEPDDRARYREMAADGVTPGGHLILATFAADGPEQCSGLPVVRFDAMDLADVFSKDFTPVGHRREHHRTPAGIDQPFTWLVLQRTVR